MKNLFSAITVLFLSLFVPQQVLSTTVDVYADVDGEDLRIFAESYGTFVGN